MHEHIILHNQTLTVIVARFIPQTLVHLCIYRESVCKSYMYT